MGHRILDKLYGKDDQRQYVQSPNERIQQAKKKTQEQAKEESKKKLEEYKYEQIEVWKYDDIAVALDLNKKLQLELKLILIIADREGLLITNTKDLRAMITYAIDHMDDYYDKYRLNTKNLNDILRKLTVYEFNQEYTKLF